MNEQVIANFKKKLSIELETTTNDEAQLISNMVDSAAGGGGGSSVPVFTITPSNEWHGGDYSVNIVFGGDSYNGSILIVPGIDALASTNGIIYFDYTEENGTVSHNLVPGYHTGITGQASGTYYVEENVVAVLISFDGSVMPAISSADYIHYTDK